ncbi:MAG TPA: hypothetical protein VF290_07835 [Pyrinomonadaceae bacterium]
MATHTSATAQEPHANQTRTNTIINALKRRAQAVLNDTSIDPQTRAIVRYGLETNDPWLAELVRRADAGETVVGAIDFSQTPDPEDDVSEEKIEALAEMICQAGDESAGRCSCLWERLKTPPIPKHSRTRRSTLLLLAALRRTCTEWLMRSLP